MLRTLRAWIAPAALTLLAGCLSVSPDANSTTLDFDMGVAGQAADWEVGGADFPAGRAADVGLVGEVRTLPSPLPATQTALYQSGTNVSGDLFVFLKKRWTGLLPNTSYAIAIAVEYASNVQSGCTTGVGPSVWIKAGASDLEPEAVADAQGVYRMNIDKGVQSAAGSFTQLGDIRNGLSGCPSPGTFALNTTGRQRQSLAINTDVDGAFWLFVGTQSTALARHEVYITHIRVTLYLAN